MAAPWPPTSAAVAPFGLCASRPRQVRPVSSRRPCRQALPPELTFVLTPAGSGPCLSRLPEGHPARDPVSLAAQRRCLASSSAGSRLCQRRQQQQLHLPCCGHPLLVLSHEDPCTRNAKNLPWMRQVPLPPQPPNQERQVHLRETCTTTSEVDFVKYPFGCAEIDYMVRQVPLRKTCTIYRRSKTRVQLLPTTARERLLPSTPHRTRTAPKRTLQRYNRRERPPWTECMC